MKVYDDLKYKIINRKALKEKAKLMALLEKSEELRYNTNGEPLTPKARKRLDIEDYALGAVVGMLFGGMVGFIKGEIDVKALTDQAYAEHGEEISKNQAEAMDKVLTELSKYPLDLSNVNIDNIDQVMSDAYDNCFIAFGGHFGNFQIIIKEGWNAFFIDYRNGLEDKVNAQLASAINDYVDPSYATSILTTNTLVSGFAAAGIMLGVLYGKNKYNQYKADKLDKDIQRLEILEKCQEDANGDREIIEQNIDKELGLAITKA